MPRWPDLAERFRGRIKTTTETGCWEWTGSKKIDGYGEIEDAGRVLRAHRAAFELFIGPIPDGMVVMHLCNNPGCVNPNHLKAGTQSDNMQHCASCGRTLKGDRSWARQNMHLVNRGAKSGAAKLSETQAQEIIRRSSSGERVTALSIEYGVSLSAISNIVRGRTWKHLQRPL